MCPTCKRKLPVTNERGPYAPFCSERCRLVDLGAWLDGAHRISSPVSEEDLDGGPAADADESSGPN